MHQRVRWTAPDRRATLEQRAPRTPRGAGVVATRALGQAHSRIQGIDAGRGAAMLFVCLSHFAVNFFVLQGNEGIRSALWVVGMVASPTFMLISGIMVGLMWAARPQRFGRFARMQTGRALFMLTIGHALILLTFLPHYASLRIAAGRGFITDVIAVAILLGPFVVQRLGIRGRLYLAAALMLTAWGLTVLWLPTSRVGFVVRYILVGPWNELVSLNFPVLPWLAVYFVGSALGGWFGQIPAAERSIVIERKLLRFGGAAVAMAIAIPLGFMVLSHFVSALSSIDALNMLSSPFQKYPPSPTYVAFYGGIGLLITGGLLMADRKGGTWLVNWLSTIGRSSLFVFLLQFFVYNIVLHSVEWPFPAFWPVYFAATVAIISIGAKLWDDRGWNRWFNLLDWFKREQQTPPDFRLSGSDNAAPGAAPRPLRVHSA